MKKLKLLIGLSVLAASVNGQSKDSQPNVIYIIMDDLGYGDIGCYGQEKIETPHIDRLSREGLSFTQHYTGSPVSAPARCVLMTGMHSGHAQIRANDEMAFRGAVNNYDSMFVHRSLEGQYPLKANTMTLGRMMQMAGYATGCFGKWGMGYPGSDGAPNKQGFMRFYGYNCQRQAHTYYPPFLYSDEQRVYLQNKVLNPHAPLGKGLNPYDKASYANYTQKEYANDLIFDELIHFVDDYKERPFFLMWATPLPHVSLQVPERWVKYYVDKLGDEKPYTGTAGYLPCRYPHATYAAMISYFDEQIGKLVEKLKAEHLYENTIIMFTSDNGPTFNGGSDSPWFHSGGPFKSEYGWGKCFVHEGGIRVPFIVSWPNKIKSGIQSNHICAFQDIMPTLAEIGQTPCPLTDGISLYPTLMGDHDQQQQHKYLYWEYPDPKIGLKAVRMGKWKGIIENIRQGSTKMYLYNLDKDLREEHDVSELYPDVVEKMEQIMAESHTYPENSKFWF